MSKLVTPQLILNGDTFLPRHGYSATVEMSVGGHSAFAVSFPASATETYAGALMENAIEFIGKRMSIGLDDGAMEYTGLVTSVDLKKGTGASGTIVVSGHGPSVLLASSVQCLSYEEGAPLSHVVSDTLKGHSTEILRAIMGAGTDIALPYTVQYNESDLSFLQRLCRRYGLWFYHNGQDYCIGRSGSEQIEGTYGTDVTAFNLSTALRGRGPEVSGHDWTRDNLLETPSSAFVPKSGHPYFGQVREESDFAFAKRGSYDYTAGQHEFSRQMGMDTATKVTVFGNAAGMVTATGSSELVGLRVADILALQGIDFKDTKEKHTFGNYDITKITHSFDHSGHYQNRFEAVPADTDHPPYSDGFTTPICADQRGRVLDNADPEGMGRVKVQFSWQRQISASTPWIKTPTPYAGSGRGFYFIPEKGEEVLVGFEGGNPEKPYVIGGGFNANAKSGFADRENNIKAIRTRSGHLIELNDSEGREMITIKDKNENLFQIDTKNNDITINAKNNINVNAENNITVTAKETIKLSAKNIELDAQEDLTTGAGKNISNSAGESFNTIAKNKNDIVEEEIMVNAKKLQETADEISVNSTSKNLTLFSKKSVDVQSNDKVKLF